MRVQNVETDNIISDRDMRNKCISHYEVLEKVKNVLLIPETDVATMDMVAQFYEVSKKTIGSLVDYNRDEIATDGLLQLTGNETKDYLVNLNFKVTNFRGYFECDGIKFANRSNLLFTRRAILRVGMLLRDSKVAKEVRTQLLNIEEKTSNDVKVHDINEEQQLALSLGMAMASGDVNALMVASTNMMNYKNRHIIKLQNDNKALAGEILEWKDRNKLNAGIRKLSAVTDISFGIMWNELYKNLQYKHGICLKKRGDKPYIQWIEENEWKSVLSTFCAMCEAYGQSPTEMFQQTTPRKALVSAT